MLQNMAAREFNFYVFNGLIKQKALLWKCSSTDKLLLSTWQAAALKLLYFLWNFNVQMVKYNISIRSLFELYECIVQCVLWPRSKFPHEYCSWNTDWPIDMKTGLAFYSYLGGQ